MQLPQEKGARLRALLHLMQHKHTATKRELQSLAGVLYHASTIIKPGRSFLRRIFELIASLKLNHHRARLNKCFHAELEWWSTFMGEWNAKSMFYRSSRESPDVEFLERCVRLMGLWGHLEWSMVTNTVATKVLHAGGVHSS